MGCSNNETDKRETPPLRLCSRRRAIRTGPQDKDWRLRAGHTTRDGNGAVVFTLFDMDELVQHRMCLFPFLLSEVLFVIYICMYKGETSNSQILF
jgi:hypothetical protein